VRAVLGEDRKEDQDRRTGGQAVKPKRLLRDLQRQGWSVRQGGRHIVVSRDGFHVSVSRSLNESDRNVHNLMATLRRGGFVPR
jgi:hypothetical protein